jgi:hypothetical protein
MAHDTLRAGDLTAVIGDNEAHGDHRAGLNGVHSLIHRTEPISLFVPASAGLNLEHILDGDRELVDAAGARRVFFEPRNAPMRFRKISDTEAELHQEPTPTFKVESRTRFSLVAPHYLDFQFRFKPTAGGFRYGWMGLFWASYMNAPEDKSMYFRRGGLWQQLCTVAHSNQSTVVHQADKTDLTFTPETREALFKSLSPLKFEDPFFYGLVRRHIFIVMFDRSEGIRFAHSPSGGGTNRDAETTNPAWDFQFILPTFEVGREYGFRARAVYRERCSRREVFEEFKAWRQSLALWREQHPGWETA